MGECLILCLCSVISIIKACVAAPFCIAYVTTLNALHSVFYMPKDTLKAYRAVATTEYIGRNVRILSLLLLPVPIAMKPLTIIIGSVLVALFLAFSLDAMTDTFLARSWKGTLFGGFRGVLSRSCDAVRDTFHWNAHSFPSYLDEFRQSRHPSGQPFDIHAIEIVIGLIVACIGLIVCVPAIAVIGAVKCVPGIVYTLYKLWYLFLTEKLDVKHDVMLICFPCFIIAHALIPAGAILAYLVCCCEACVCGISCAGVAHSEGSPAAGVCHAFRLVAQFDVKTNYSVFGVETSTCGGTCASFARSSPDARPWRDQQALVVTTDQPTDQRMNTNDIEAPEAPVGPQGPVEAPPRGAATRRHPEAPPVALREPPPLPVVDARQRWTSVRSRFVALEEVWTSFFNAAQSASEDAIAKGWLGRDAFEAYEASLFVGVPSLVVIDALLRSQSANGIVLMDGKTEVTDENRPRGFFPDRIFTPMLELRSKLVALNLTESEIAAFKLHAVTCGEHERPTSLQPQSGPKEGVPPLTIEGQIMRDRQKEMMRVLAGVQSIAIDVSRAPTFRRRFSNVIAAVTLQQCDRGSGVAP
eukprot:COSAG02_NODE_1175_length_14063_cov_24.197794_9_plen_583_part_00